MKEMNVLTVNGQTYAVRDAGAVRMDAPQPLTKEQKAQARKNIGIGEDAFTATIEQCHEAGMEEVRRISDKIGVQYSQWNEPVGESNVTTAKDLCRVLLYCSGFPKLYDIWNTPKYTARRLLADGTSATYEAVSTVMGDAGKVLSDSYTVIGGKTGSTQNGIYNLACVVKSNANPDDWYAITAMKAGSATQRFDAVKKVMDIIDGGQLDAYADPLDEIAWEGLTYRDIFIRNNWAPNINHNNLYYPNKNLKGNLASFDNGYGVDSSSGTGGHCEIVKNNTQAANYISPYALEVTGTGYRLTTPFLSFGKGVKVFCACNVNISAYTAGKCGIHVGAYTNCSIDRATDGYEQIAKTFTLDAGGAPFIGGNRGFNGTGYVNNPVIVRGDLFTTAPTEAEWAQMYQNFNMKLIQSMFPDNDIPAAYCCAIKIPAYTARAYQYTDLTPALSAGVETEVIPASVTKLLVAAAVLDHVPDLDEKTTITQEDIDLCNPYGGDLRLGDTLTIRDYLYMMMLPSSNISATVLCRVVGEKVLRSRML